MQQHSVRQTPVQRQAGQAAENRAPVSNNTGMPDNLKAGVENLSGMAMDDVKVHYNSAQPAAMQAHAYAQGTDIHIAPGQEQHLPHEAWHVVQQKQGRVRPTFQMKSGTSINDDVGLESEADAMGARALSAGTAAVMSGGGKDGEIRQAMAVSGRPVFQLAIMTGILQDDKKSIRGAGSGIVREINADAKWQDGEYKDGDIVEYEFLKEDGITAIYGKSNKKPKTALARLDDATRRKRRGPIKPTKLEVSDDALNHIWDRHTPRGIFDLKRIETDFEGDTVALFSDVTGGEFYGLMEQIKANLDKFTWWPSGGQMRGKYVNIEMLCDNLNGTTFDLFTCYPPKWTVKKTIIEAALKAHASYDAFLAALGDYDAPQ
ncbi:DUF4157 domain-containing protein [Undibacterium sp. Ji50W]|uniref:eCIS core domain-containing protein n=1 Tax=Undibacterium sp. Ji50W TaxID=3413041 RepID=UPI003BF2EDCF